MLQKINYDNIGLIIINVYSWCSTIYKWCKKMLIVGAAPFINGRPNYQLIVGAALFINGAS